MVDTFALHSQYMCSTNCSTFSLFVERNAEKIDCSAHCSTIAVFVERNAEQIALLVGIDYSYKVNRNRAVNLRDMACYTDDGVRLWPKGASQIKRGAYGNGVLL